MKLTSICIATILAALISCQTQNNHSEVRAEEPPPLPADPAPEGISTEHLEIFGDIPALTNDSVTACSYNIRFLGSSSKRNHQYLVDTIATACDVVVIQELVSPPKVTHPELIPLIPETFPDGTPTNLDPESGEFFDMMAEKGYTIAISEEDSGRVRNHSNGNESEWFVAFYNPKKLELDRTSGLTGFIDTPRFRGGKYNRVPYAFSFRSRGAPRAGQSRRSRRRRTVQI